MPRYKESNISFVNPYHFVSLEEKCRRGFDYDDIKKQKGLLTGFVTCSLKTLTPVFIPNTTPDEPKTFREFNKICDNYDFFSYKDINGIIDPPAPNPVIPGSEIRGMIRSAFEAVTNSCLSTTDKDRLLYKRTTVPAQGCGLLKYDESSKSWMIYKCKKYGVAIRITAQDPHDFSHKISNFYDGQEVYVKISGRNYVKNIGNNRTISLFPLIDDITDKPTRGYTKGWFHWGEKFGSSTRKHHESVFVPIKGEAPVNIDPETLKRLLENFRLYDDNTVNLHKKTGHHYGYQSILPEYKSMKDLKIEDLNNLPVYYTQYLKKFYLCPAAIGREVFDNTIHTILKTNGGYQPCDSVQNLCPACVLMGLAGEKDNAAASRVRFTDALYKNNDDGDQAYSSAFNSLYEPVSILPELASPKPSAVEFYLKKPENYADVWNYDYAFKWKRKPNGRLTNIPEPISYKPQINGRKFYWHKNITNVNSIKVDFEKASERNVAVRPLKKGVSFSFKVYFNDITEDELKKLLWVLEIGGLKQNAHKIGMGKPLGMGSVKVSIERLDIRNIEFGNESIVWKIKDHKEILKKDILEEIRNLSASYHNNKVKASKAKPATSEKRLEETLGCSEKVLEEFLLITDFKDAPDNVMYPQNVINQQGKPIPESYKWFVGNRQCSECKGTGTSPIIHQTLYDIKEPELKKYIET